MNEWMCKRGWKRKMQKEAKKVTTTITKKINDIGVFERSKAIQYTHLANIHTLYILSSRPNDASEHVFLSPFVFSNSPSSSFYLLFLPLWLDFFHFTAANQISNRLYRSVFVDVFLCERAPCVCVLILSCGTYHFHLNGWNMINSKNFHSRFFVQPPFLRPIRQHHPNFAQSLSFFLSFAHTYELIFHNWSGDGRECMNHYFYLNKITFC